MHSRLRWPATMGMIVAASVSFAGVGDPQIKTDHPWYPGELSCSTFDRLFRAQAQLFERVTGRQVESDEDKALAAWYWRNLNYFHSTGGREDVWEKGLEKGEESREYWSGLFGFGYGLCYTTHHQWSAEMLRLLGPSRARSVGVPGHTSFEVWLTGGPYGEGQWALLDHDVSTVVFTPNGERLLGLTEISRDLSTVKQSDKRRGFIPAGLHPDDPDCYKEINWVGFTTGYAGPPPMVNLRAGETLRRYGAPGLPDGKTFAYWGINYNVEGIPGPARDRTWVNVPATMYGSGKGCPNKPGQARYANAVYTYKPDFASAKYKEGVIDESDDRVTFEWYSPYIIAATPPPAAAREEWGIYKPGCTNGLVLHGSMTCPVEISVDQGRTWKSAGTAREGLDLTDFVKGHHQYWIRFGAPAKTLAGSGLTMVTVCQCSPTLIPRLKSGANRVTYEASGNAFIGAGPNLGQALPHVVEGAMNSRAVTLELAAPRHAKAVRVYAAAHAASGNPPADCAYNIDCSTDAGKTWRPVLKDWRIIRRAPEPNDFWSQTFMNGDAAIDAAGPVRVRFTNTGGKPFLRAEAHLAYEAGCDSPLKVTFAWKNGAQPQTANHVYRTSPGAADTSWIFNAGPDPKLTWIELAAD